VDDPWLKLGITLVILTLWIAAHAKVRPPPTKTKRSNSSDEERLARKVLYEVPRKRKKKAP
jgi:hypothetical protein